MKYKLKRKLRGCPMPVGTVSSEVVRRGDSITTWYDFAWTYPTRSCIPDNRVCKIPAWLCGSMPYYFGKVTQ